MTPDEIRRRCRKVFLTTQNNAIFWPIPFGYQQEISVFMSEEKAEDKTRYNHAKQLECQSRAQRAANVPTGINYKTQAFYLVPASKIDK